MAIQYSTAHRTAVVDDLVTKCGTSATIKIFTGTQPANCATTDSGTLLVTLTAEREAERDDEESLLLLIM
jgi:hypothetical protein